MVFINNSNINSLVYNYKKDYCILEKIKIKLNKKKKFKKKKI